MTSGGPDSSATGELRFAAVALTLAGAGLVVLALGIDRLAGGSESAFGPNQLLGLALGSITLVLGLGLLRSARLRAAARRLWPFGAGPPERPRRILGLAVWLAGLASLLDLGLRVSQHELGLRWSSLNPHAGWMTPLSYGAILLLAGAVLALFAARGWGHLGAPRLALFTCLFLAVAGALSVYEEELHWMPVALLSLGIAAQGSRMLAGRRPGFERLVRVTARPLAFAVALAAIWPFAWAEWSEERALAAMPAAPGGAPNVLLIVLDTVRAQNMSLYGYGRETTPNLEALAPRSIVYDRALAPSSWTLPSHASLFTGRPPHQQSSNFGHPLDDALPTLAEVLRDRGWYTLGVVANRDNAFPHTGLDRGFVRFDAGVPSIDELLGSSGPGRLARWSLRRVGKYWIVPPRKDADVINARFLDLVEKRGARPFFAFLNYYDAHFPFDHPVPPASLVSGMDPAEGPRLVGDYDREIAFLDDRLARLLGALDRAGVLSRTIVVITSDHGEEFGEHGVTGHGYNLYLTTLAIPLLISGPGAVPEGARIERPVSIQDLPATLMALTGLGEGPFPGRSLVPGAGAELASSPVLSELSGTPSTPIDEIPGWDQRSLVAGTRHYLQTDDSEELYDLAADPEETRDLTRLPQGAVLLPRFRAVLSSLVEDEHDPGSGDDRSLASVPGSEPQGQR